MTTAGSSVEDATHRALQIYELARLNYLAYTIGTPEPVPQRDQDEYLARREDGPYRRERGPSSTGEGSFWKYQRKLLGEEL
jgi:ribulose-5-phosphate 4-epimerase/fuculose-1-phosphate aldolase